MPRPKQRRGRRPVAATGGWLFDVSAFAFCSPLFWGLLNELGLANVNCEWRPTDCGADLFDSELLSGTDAASGCLALRVATEIRDKLIQTSAWSLLNRSYKCQLLFFK